MAYASKFAQVEGLSRLVNLLVAALASVETVEHDLMTGVGTLGLLAHRACATWPPT